MVHCSGITICTIIIRYSFFNVEKNYFYFKSYIHLSNDIDKKNIAIINKKNKNIYFELIRTL